MPTLFGFFRHSVHVGLVCGAMFALVACVEPKRDHVRCVEKINPPR